MPTIGYYRNCTCGSHYCASRCSRFYDSRSENARDGRCRCLSPASAPPALCNGTFELNSRPCAFTWAMTADDGPARAVAVGRSEIELAPSLSLRRGQRRLAEAHMYCSRCITCSNSFFGPGRLPLTGSPPTHESQTERPSRSQGVLSRRSVSMPS